MSVPFEARSGLVVIDAEVAGPRGTANIRLAVDTGATRTVIDARILSALGYDPTTSADHVEVTTGSGVESVPLVLVEVVKAIGHERHALSMLAHTLPATAGIDGLLGLDFLREQVLTLDFKTGKITLN